MYQTLINPDSLADYSTKEAGPIIIALAFVIGVGGLSAAAILVCGWQRVRSAGINMSQRRVEIVCK